MTDQAQPQERDIVAFMMGEAPFDGVWFSERHPVERGAFWWRKHLQAEITRLRAQPSPRERDIDIVFDGPPGPEAGRFVEVEDGHGRSINVGKWMQRPDGLWALRLRAQPSPREVALERLLEQAQACILGDTPEDMTHEDARQDTLEKIKRALASDGREGGSR